MSFSIVRCYFAGSRVVSDPSHPTSSTVVVLVCFFLFLYFRIMLSAVQALAVLVFVFLLSVLLLLLYYIFLLLHVGRLVFDLSGAPKFGRLVVTCF